jgi:FdhE protein
MNQDLWLTRHPYLEPVARFQAQVDRAGDLLVSKPSTPNWDRYHADFDRGVPLLLATAAEIDFQPAEKTVMTLVERLAAGALGGEIGVEIKALNTELHLEASAPRRALGWLLSGDVFVSEYPGLLRYLGWSALARHFRPILDAFSAWCDETMWLRSYCPACGSLPAMAQLVGVEAGRRRFLACGHCGSRWHYQRTGCPFCENKDDHQLAVLLVEGEGGLRIDYCENCNGYLKTYDGQGSESLLLADWTSIHLDLVAQDRGLQRLASSLYEL